jgi:hypothetical protein
MIKKEKKGAHEWGMRVAVARTVFVKTPFFVGQRPYRYGTAPDTVISAKVGMTV